MEQLDAWKGEFGKAYTDRNVVDWQSRQPAFHYMLDGLPIHRVLEAGCNRGHNLIALKHILEEDSEVVGIEPNPYALAIAQSVVLGSDVSEGNIFSIPFLDDSFDLVFTAGVLIHISLNELPHAMAEIYRVSRRYIMAVEYFSESEEVIDYRGHSNLLWKRDFPAHYKSLFPDLAIIRSGYWGVGETFERANWWMFEKIAPSL